MHFIAHNLDRGGSVGLYKYDKCDIYIYTGCIKKSHF